MNKLVIRGNGRLQLIAILLFFCCMASIASGLEVFIDSVNMQPELPGMSDIIDIEIDGTASHSPSWVDHYDYSQNLTSLGLDLYVDVSPENPTTADPVSIYAWTWFGYAERYDLVSTAYSITGYDIGVEVVMRDKGYGITIPWAGGGSVQVGTLTEGDYWVTADMYMIPFGGSIPELYESGGTSFNVVPEPATLFLLALGALLTRDCRHKSGNFDIIECR